MATVGIRELKAKTSEIIHAVREEQARYTVTHHGKPVAVIMPIDDAPPEQQNDLALLDQLFELGREISEADDSGMSATEWLITNRR